MLFYPFEIFNIILTIIVVGLIFSRSFETEEILFWIKVAGISIILHELGHRFVANFLGYTAIYEISFLGLLLGLFFRLANFPFIFFIPGYVHILGNPTPRAIALIAFAGPFVNLLLFIFGKIAYTKTQREEYYLLSNLNLWLFILNMLPIPPLDGFKVLYGLLH